MQLPLREKCKRLKTPRQLRWLFVVVQRKSLATEKIMKKKVEALIQKQMVMIVAKGVLRPYFLSKYHFHRLNM